MKKWLWLLAIPLIILPGCGEKAAEPTLNQRFCSVTQGFNFTASKQNPVGHITYLTIGGVKGNADLTVNDPMNPTARINVFGVVSWLAWRETPDEPIVFAAQISAANKEKLAALGKTDLTNLNIEFGFTLYNYDPKAKSYYKSISSGAAILKGTLYDDGEHSLFLMSEDAGIDITAPENFNFQLGIKGTGLQQIEIADQAGESYTKGWGE